MVQNFRTPIDKLIGPSVQTVVKNAQAKSSFIQTNQTSDGATYEDFYFVKRDVVAEVLDRRELSIALADLKRRYAGWAFDVLVIRYVNTQVSAYLNRARDRWGIREYENYQANEKERRWMPMRFVSATRLRMILQQARVLERDLHLKGEGYHIALQQLEALEHQGKRVRMGDILEEVGPLIQQYRLTGKDPTRRAS